MACDGWIDAAGSEWGTHTVVPGEVAIVLDHVRYCNIGDTDGNINVQIDCLTPSGWQMGGGFTRINMPADTCEDEYDQQAMIPTDIVTTGDNVGVKAWCPSSESEPSVPQHTWHVDISDGDNTCDGYVEGTEKCGHELGGGYIDDHMYKCVCDPDCDWDDQGYDETCVENGGNGNGEEDLLKKYAPLIIIAVGVFFIISK